MSLENFILGKILGKGTYGSVRIVERKEDHKIYAMKSVIINVLTEKEKQNSFNEVRLLASLKHKNIIDYKESFFDDARKTLNIVMEYADDGDLRTKISETLKNHLSFEESTIWNVLIQTLEGLKYLHKNNIIHRDLKSANIFLTKDGLIKIGDLNVSTIAKKGVANTQTGTPFYASPEIWNDKPYNSKCDIWSLGCIIYEMAALHVPFRGTSLHQLYTRIMKGNYPKIPSRYSKDLKIIIKIILNVDAQKRPSAEELLKNEIIQKKMKEIGLNKIDSNKLSEKAMLIKTIKIPKNISQINKQLPEKRYELEIKKNKEDMFNHDEYEFSKSHFYKISSNEKNIKFKNDIQSNLMNKNLNNININYVIVTTNDTDRINNEINKIEAEINNKKIFDNYEQNNAIQKEKIKKPFKDTGYHFFNGNLNNKNINNNNNINLFLINKKQEKQNEQEPKVRRNTGPSCKILSKENNKLSNIRPKSTNNYKQKNIKKNNINAKEGKSNINIVKHKEINKRQTPSRKNICLSANKNIRKKIRSPIYSDKEIIEKKSKNKESAKKINPLISPLNHKNNHSKPKKQRAVSSKHYKQMNLYNEGKINDKNKINCKNHYNEYYKNNQDKHSDENNEKQKKYKIIYQKIEVIKKGKKNYYKKGKTQVKYIDIGNLSKNKNIKNIIKNNSNIKSRKNYQVIESKKGLNLIVPNKMMN